MWLRPSWDSQYTRTETERATTPYYIDSVHRARYVSWCVTSVPSLVYRYSCTVLIETEHTQRLCRSEVTYHHRTLGLSASWRSGTHTHTGTCSDRCWTAPAPTASLTHGATKRSQLPPPHPASRLYAKQCRSCTASPHGATNRSQHPPHTQHRGCMRNSADNALSRSSSIFSYTEGRENLHHSLMMIHRRSRP